MARASFGGGAADFVFTTGPSRLLRLTEATLTVWNARTGGARLTDLRLNGNPADSIPVGPDGQIPPFQGPDGVLQLWVDAGGVRGLLTASTAADAQAAVDAAAAVEALFLTGTGSPEGNVTAPVGATYKDQAATNGAVEWVKHSGTGNVGWRVVYGDTGWRDITSQTLFPVNGSLFIRRRKNTVSLKMSVLAPTTDQAINANLYAPPTGFKCEFGTNTWLTALSNARIAQTFYVAPSVVGVGGRLNAGAWTDGWGATTLLVAIIEWSTFDLWPTALPGTP